MSTGNYDDEVAAALGDQVVLNADGAKASVKINRGKTLEVANCASAVMRASNGQRRLSPENWRPVMRFRPKRARWSWSAARAVSIMA